MTKYSLVGLGTLGTFFLFQASTAHAQPNAPAETVSAEPAAKLTLAPPPAATSAVPANAAPLAPPSVESVSFGNCRLGEHAGVDPNDARTAASIVCRELPPQAASANSYRVDLDKLGTHAFVTLTAESNGAKVDSRRMPIDRIEDVPLVAPRLVDALIHNKSLKETERVGNLTTADATTPVRRYGQMQFGGGVLGAVAPGLATVSPGLELALRYDTQRWVLGGQLRFAWGVGNNDQFNMIQLGVGPRYMLSTADTSLFLGGGMAIERLGERKESNTKSGAGVGAYAEVGVEMMRLHHNRLNVALRTDFPTFKTQDDYLVPISLTTSFLFD